MSASLSSPPLELLLLAVFGALLLAIALAIAVALSLRALAGDRRAPWHWARRRGEHAVAVTGRLLRFIGLRSAAAIAASVVALVLFAGVAEDVVEYPTLPVDEKVRAIVQAQRTPPLDHFFGAITWLGASSVLAVLVAAAALLLALRRSRRTALLALGGPLVAALAIITLKRAFQRDRPEGALALGIHTYSFPSGHATASAASLLTIAYVLAREQLLPWWSVPVAAVLSFLVGLSRIYLDAHWTTDVAGGWAAGAGLALAGVALYERLRAVDRAHNVAEGKAPDAPAGDPEERVTRG